VSNTEEIPKDHLYEAICSIEHMSNNPDLSVDIAVELTEITDRLRAIHDNLLEGQQKYKE